MTDYKQIREALHFTELTSEEKQRRGILGRLYGPCASIAIPTRNGRFYNEDLWEKVFNENEIVKEMFENGGCMCELDHPVDREETCSQNIAAIIPEPPKKDKDGHLICYVDLIDTPCGRIAYQLAKYGFKLGISSRGTGDLYTDENGNESVDPDTYDFTTFDLVLLPALKEARLEMVESYNTKKKNLKKALTEAYKGASEEDKKVMKKIIENLDYDMKLKEAFNAKELEELMELSKKCGFKTVKALYDYMQENNVTEKNLLANLREKCKDCKEACNEELIIGGALDGIEYEELDDVDEALKAGKDLSTKELTDIVADKKMSDKEKAKVIAEAKDDEESEDEIEDEEEIIEEEPADEKEEDKKEEKEEKEESEIETVKDFIDQLKDYKKLPLEFAPIEIDGVEYPVNLIVDDSDEEKLVLKLDYSPVEEDNIEAEEEAEVSEEEAVPEEAIEETEPAEDNGEEEVLESLKEMVRQKSLLEKQLKTLQNEKAVSDTEVESLKEELSRYKESFARVSNIAAKSKGFEKQVGALTEKNKIQESKIKELSRVNSEKLNESVSSKAKADEQVKKLTESLNSKQTELNAANKRLTEQASMYKKKLAENANIANGYKTKLVEVFNRYMSTKADMLGVTTQEIKNKLNENYTMDDIERVCDEILTAKTAQARVSFNVSKNAKVRVNESVQNKKSSSNGLEVDDLLLELAGLKDESWI